MTIPLKDSRPPTITIDLHEKWFPKNPPRGAQNIVIPSIVLCIQAVEE